MVCSCRNLLARPVLPQFVHANTRSVLTHSPPFDFHHDGRSLALWSLWSLWSLSSNPPSTPAPFSHCGARQSPWQARQLDLPAIAFPQILGKMPASSPDHASANFPTMLPGPCFSCLVALSFPKIAVVHHDGNYHRPNLISLGRVDIFTSGPRRTDRSTTPGVIAS